LVKIELDWDYTTKKVHLSMKPYLDKSLRQFDNVVPMKRQHLSYLHAEPKYGATQQFAQYVKSELVSDEEKTCIQKITGKILWYRRGADGMILTPLSAIAVKQSKPTINTIQQSQKIIDYLATQEPAVGVTYMSLF
jgi:hypothetical protein